MTKTGETIKINGRNEFEREIMTCLSKIFLLTYKNTRMENLFNSQISYLACKNGADDILKKQIPQTLICDMETREFLEILTLPKIKGTHQ